jgi:hypothetical protein
VFIEQVCEMCMCVCVCVYVYVYVYVCVWMVYEWCVYDVIYLLWCGVWWCVM